MSPGAGRAERRARGAGRARGHAFVPQKSFHYAEAGCAAGDGLACAVLGRHHELGLGTAWAPARAVEFYERACTAGVGLGCSRLGAMYDRGHGVERDHSKATAYRARARERWLAACRGDEPRWCPYAASALPDGEPTASELDQRACNSGIARSCIALLHNQLLHTTPSPDAAVRELDRWCNEGHAVAYDRRIERAMYRWKYSPFTLDGEPQPVCSVVTFIYTQH